MSIQRPQANHLVEPTLDEAGAPAETPVGDTESFPKLHGGRAASKSAAKIGAPQADRGKFDIVFAVGVSVALWAAIIFLFAVLF